MNNREQIEDQRLIKLFLNEEEQAFAEFTPPIQFVLDTTKIPDGKHQLKIIASSSTGVEGQKIIPFEVRNGPEIAVVGLNSHEVIDAQVPITINAYGNETKDQFIIKGSETPKAIPAGIWALLISFVAFACYYLIMYVKPDLYQSFF